MSRLNVFTALSKRLYENYYKNINEEKDLCQLQIKRNLWRSTRFLHANTLCADSVSYNHAVLFPGDHGFINPVLLLKPVGNLHRS